MEIVGIDVDDRADGNGKAGLTWISKDLLKTPRQPYNGKTDYAIAPLRTHINETVRSLLDDNLKNNIVPVNKVTGYYSDSSFKTKTTQEDLWIPSVYELGLRTNIETTGAKYSTKFQIDVDRIKKNGGYARQWLTRSVVSGFNCGGVATGGAYDSVELSVANSYIALGFCTN